MSLSERLLDSLIHYLQNKKKKIKSAKKKKSKKKLPKKTVKPKIIKKKKSVVKKKAVTKAPKKKPLKKSSQKVTKKIAKKKIVAKKKPSIKPIKKKVSVKKSAKKPKDKEVKGDLIGKVTHYFSKISVIVLKVSKGKVAVGDTILIKGKSSHLQQKIKSLQIESEDVKSAKKGQLVGLKVDKKVQVGDGVYLLD